jgi:alkylation response protein AidB-like acyl-CoA dehydrogenase
MDFNLSEEQELLVNSAERYGRERYDFETRRKIIDGADGLSREQWAAFAEMGWLCLTVPEEAGGLGGDMVDVALMIEALGGALVVEPLIDTAILGVALVAACPETTVRDDLLAAVMGGETILALAHAEAGGRCEYHTPVATQAVAEGDGWRLTGRKLRVFHGAGADVLLTTARLGDAVALFAVPRDAAGVTVDDYRLINGAHAADVTLAEVTVGPSALILAPGTVEPVLDEALDRAVLASCAATIGSMEAVMAMTSDYLKERVQFGQPLAKFQALQHRMAEMFIDTERARSAVYRALAAFDMDDAEARRRAVSAAKVLVQQTAHFVTGQGIQLHGGIGMTDEYAVGHHFKASLVFGKRFGDTDVHLARSIGLPL